ncbi:MAG: hypothetical protein H7196_04745 [candidate division SR1 bacterium]|nr:hypothetical protein [candidate division SR1 bacterium]
MTSREILRFFQIYLPSSQGYWSTKRAQLIALLIAANQYPSLMLSVGDTASEASKKILHWQIGRNSSNFYKINKAIVSCYPEYTPNKPIQVYWTVSKKLKAEHEPSFSRLNKDVLYTTYAELYLPLEIGLKRKVLRWETYSNKELISEIKKRCC